MLQVCQVSSRLGWRCISAVKFFPPAPYAKAYAKASELARALRDAGQSVSVLDLGGGLGIGYKDEPGISLAAFANMVKREVGDLGVKLLLEPGRYLVGPAGVAARLGDSAKAWRRQAVCGFGCGDE